MNSKRRRHVRQIGFQTRVRMNQKFNTKGQRDNRWGELAFTLGGAMTATAVIVTLYRQPFAPLVPILILIPLFLARFSERADIVGLMVGATFGNLTELLCDAAGVWEHVTRPVFGVAPFYIFACYPLLGLATPRLIAAVLGRARPVAEGAGAELRDATIIWALHLGLSCRFGADNGPQAIVCAACLALTVARFHSPHDLTTALLGGLLGMVWELPCTRWGAWRFPHSQLFGLIPFWLPLAYAVFFVNLGRITVALAEWRERAAMSSGRAATAVLDQRQ
jgi:hypothetical protein